jgi:outer membrane protein TolC
MRNFIFPLIHKSLLMKTHSSHIVLFIALLFFTANILSMHAQESDTISDIPSVDVAKLKPEDYNKLVLPPLSVFLDAAENSAKVNSLKATREQEEGALVTTKREWMNTLRVFGNYQYGALGANVTTAGEGSGQTMVYSGQVQSIYNGGAALSLPLDVVYDRKNRIRKQEARIKQADYQVQQAIDELKMDIADTYIAAVQQLNTLKVRAESVVLANSDIKMSETNYLSGNLELSELNYRKSMQATAITNYETTRAELNKAILHLELLTNVKILKKQ